MVKRRRGPRSAMLAQRHVTAIFFAPVSPEGQRYLHRAARGNLLPAQTNPVLYGGGSASRVLCLLIACFPSSVPSALLTSLALLGIPFLLT